MNRISKVAALTCISFVTVYVGITWFYFGSPHPCAIATRTLEWESAAWSEESRLEFARGLAVLNVLRSDLDQLQKNKLEIYLKTAPRQVVDRYLDPDFTPESIARNAIESAKKETPAQCFEILYNRLKNRFTS
jgi:hypothetical protein